MGEKRTLSGLLGGVICGFRFEGRDRGGACVASRITTQTRALPTVPYALLLLCAWFSVHVAWRWDERDSSS